MKTNQAMIRPMGQFQVTQRTSDGYFDANALLAQWNNVKENPQRKMARFFESENVKLFIEALKEDISQGADLHHGDMQIVKEVKARNTSKGKTKGQIWMHPILFIKFAMWLNPRFEVQVIKFVYDQMIQYRNNAGDAYRELSSAVARIVPKNEMKVKMRKIGEALNWVIFNAHEKMLRNKEGEEDKQKELWMFEKKVASLINEGFIHRFDDLMNYLRRQYIDRNNPKVFAV